MVDSSTDAHGSVQIRPVRPDDRFSDDVPKPRPDEDSPRWRRSLVAVAGTEVVGAASLALAPVMDSYFCEIHTTASHRRRGIGTRLYDAIYPTRARPFPVLARAMRSQPLRRAFADSLGCTVRIHCPEPWIQPTSAEAQRWISRQEVPAGYLIVAMAEQPTESVLRAWTTYFVWAHQPFGIVHPDRVPLSWEGYSRGLDAAASMIALDQDGRIVAFSLVSPDVWDGRTMIVSETVEHDQPDGTQLLKATVAASLAVLGQRNVHRVELEGHTTDPHSPALINSLPSSEGDPMDILDMNPPGFWPLSTVIART